MQKFSYLFTLLLAASVIFSSCSDDDDDNGSIPDPPTYEGVPIGSIDGVSIRWATRNVAAPGTFAPTPESAGMFFQWNRRTGISVTTPAAGVPVENWNASPAEGTMWYAENDPCPEGWRVPTLAELTALHNEEHEWTTRNGIRGRYFGTAPNRIFLPASGGRSHNTGALQNVGTWGNYWSSTADDGVGFARDLHFNNSSVSVFGWGWRSLGRSVRCVAKQQQD